jgi:hypothetical protein
MEAFRIPVTAKRKNRKQMFLAEVKRKESSGFYITCKQTEKN